MNDQQNLLNQILTHTPSISPGIAVYQRNRWAMAERALSISFPTVFQLLGDGFATLARQFLFTNPNSQADWGAWGEEFSSFIKSTPLHTALPYLSDCAALDWHIHTIERCNNSVMDRASLTRLENADPEIIYFVLNDNIKLIKSSYPIYAIWKMHQPDEAPSHWEEIANEQLHKKNSHTEHLIVFREDWKANPLTLNKSEYIFFEMMRNNKSLSYALDALANTDFNFSEWLLRSVKYNWILSVSVHNPTDYTGVKHEYL